MGANRPTVYGARMLAAADIMKTVDVSGAIKFGLKSYALKSMPTESNPCPKSEMIKRVTTNDSLQPPYEAATINIAEMIEAEKHNN